MSANVTLVATQNKANFTRKIGKYELSRTYKINTKNPEFIIGLEYGDGVDPDGQPLDDKIPGNVSIKHLTNFDGSSWNETVQCFAIDREAVNPPPKGGSKYSHIRVTYIGWVMQVLYWETTLNSSSENIKFSIDNPPEAIGADLEGTSVFRPSIQMNIYENLTGDTLMFGGRLNLIEELMNTVNEDDWNPGVTEVDLPYPEGQWLYMGADITDQPGGAFNLMHKFLQTPLYCNCGIDWVGSGPDDSHEYQGSSFPCSVPRMHIHQFRDYVDFGSAIEVDGNSVKVTRRKYSELKQRKKYCIAGTDTFHNFAALGL